MNKDKPMDFVDESDSDGDDNADSGPNVVSTQNNVQSTGMFRTEGNNIATT